MRNKIDFYSRIMVAIVLALLTSQLLVKEVFLGYSPRIRPDLADVVVEKGLALVNVDNYLAFFRGGKNTTPTQSRNYEEELAKVPFHTIVKGVYAKDIEGASYTKINVKEIEWLEIDYLKKDGTVEKILIPKGTKPPPAGLF